MKKNVSSQYNKIANRNEKILSNICMLFIVLHILNYRFVLIEESFPIISIGYIIIGTVSICYYFSLRNKYSYMIIALSLLGGMLNYIFVGNITIKILIQDCFMWAMSFPLLERKYSKKVIWGIMIFLFIGFFYHMIRGTNPNLIMNGVSRNYISVVVILILLLYYSQIEFSNSNISIIPAISGFCISIYGESRSGIIALAFLMMGVLYYKYRKFIKSKMLAYTGITVMLSVLIYYRNQIFYIFTNVFTMFTQNGLRSIRIVMWKAYFKIIKSSIFYLIFGAPLNTNTYEFYNSRYGMNLHNSFLALHEYYGLVPFVLILICIIKAISYYKDEKMYLQVILLMSLLIRSSTDNILFSTHNIPLFGFFVFYAMNSRKGVELHKKYRVH